jgi:mannose-1-phosphate guanylyltransferase/mannose-1-phosphate guanylyltransferase/mannose-6-phosphate isomerase
VEAARSAAEAGWLVTFGVSPDRPETGYGYIREGEAVLPGVRRAERFLEKPDAATAARLIAEGSHLWNAGIFLFRADAYLAALQTHSPQVLEAVQQAYADRREEGRRILPQAHAFAASPSISIDYAVMEKAERVAVVPVSMGWSDIGSWDVLHEIGGKDERGNLLGGDAIAIDSSNCLVRSDGPAVVTVGVEDLIVIASSDAVLIVPRGQSQRVREAVEALEALGRSRLK